MYVHMTFWMSRLHEYINWYRICAVQTGFNHTYSMEKYIVNCNFIPNYNYNVIKYRMIIFLLFHISKEYDEPPLSVRPSSVVV